MIKENTYSVSDSFSALTGDEFEKFVLNILRQEASSMGKKLYSDNEMVKYLYNHGLLYDRNFRYLFDAFAPSGLYDDVPTFIEVRKTNNNIELSANKVESIIKQYHAFIYRGHIASNYNKSFKLIVVTNSTREIKEFFPRGIYSQFDIWSIEDVLHIAKNYPVDYNAALELAISKHTSKRQTDELRDNIVNTSIDQFKKHNQSILEELNDRINDNGVDLVLGTGVSMDYNDKLSWDSLSNKLYDALPISERFENPNKALSILGGDNVSKSQYSITNLGSSYPSVLYNLLYPKKHPYIVGNTTLDECANLICKNTDSKMIVKKVITYNYDNYLEQALSIRGYPFHVLYRENDCLNNCFPIYHVHGFMPEDVDTIKKSQLVKTIVLSEEDYFNCYSDASNWRVAIQLTSFKDDTCLFVGNSVSDFNEKRLLNKTKQSKPHFAIIHSKGLSISDLTKLHMHFYYMLNIKIIWADSLAAIPIIIRNIVSRII